MCVRIYTHPFIYIYIYLFLLGFTLTFFYVYVCMLGGRPTTDTPCYFSLFSFGLRRKSAMILAMTTENEKQEARNYLL